MDGNAKRRCVIESSIGVVDRAQHSRLSCVGPRDGQTGVSPIWRKRFDSWVDETGTAVPCPYGSYVGTQNVGSPDTVVLTSPTAPRRMRPSNQREKKSAVRCDGITGGAC